MNIYLDMDGVLVAFEEGLAKAGFFYPHKYFHTPRNTWTDEEKAADKVAHSIMETPGFFYNLQPMHGAFLLWDSVRHLKPYILTAYPKGDRVLINRVSSEKYKWIVKHFGEDQGKRFICTSRDEKKKYAQYKDVPISLKTPEKVLHATIAGPNILVDDLPYNIQQWNEAGGIGILHQNDMLKTIEEVKEKIG